MAADDEPGEPMSRNRRLVEFAALGAGPLAVAATGVALYVQPAPWSTLGIALLVAAAALAAGAFVGFLFGIPRSSPIERPTGSGGPVPRYNVNTNLEQISDWLTKILVGVGLIQLGTLARGAGRLVDGIGAALGDGPAARAAGGSLLLFCAMSGFLIGYVTTRTRLTLVFAAFDRGELASFVDARVRARFQRDGEAMQLLLQQLEENEPEVRLGRLSKALAAASPGGRAQALILAQEQRRKSWRGPETRARLNRLVPIFRALTEADPHRHRHWGGLGFALKDLPSPDYAGAHAALDRAIKLRGNRPGHGKETYELVRAMVRLHLLGGQPPDRAAREAIARDVAVACGADEIRTRIADALQLGAAGDAADRELALLAPYLPDQPAPARADATA